jgi:hypothetical protein
MGLLNQNIYFQIEEPEIEEEVQEIQKQIQEMIEIPVLQDVTPQAAMPDVCFVFEFECRTVFVLSAEKLGSLNLTILNYF